MKYLNFCLAFLLCLFSLSVIAQTPQQIESDLLKPFKNIFYYAEKNDQDKSGEANDQFAKKLKSYCEKVPATLSYPFSSLTQEHLDISTSSDGHLRIYSWDIWSGGTMHFFENVMQYKTGAAIKAIIDTPKGDGDVRPNYNKVYTFQVSGKTYYLTVYLLIGSSKDLEEGIQVFSIENGKLNTDTRIIKTKSGLHSRIIYDYDLSRTSEKVTSEIHFDANTKSIYIPVVLENGKLTNNYIVYKFTGQYFERVKN
jgi:hypothetical protein